jgi:hypothetical protein
MTQIKKFRTPIDKGSIIGVDTSVCKYYVDTQKKNHTPAQLRTHEAVIVTFTMIYSKATDIIATCDPTTSLVNKSCFPYILRTVK